MICLGGRRFMFGGDSQILISVQLSFIYLGRDE